MKLMENMLYIYIYIDPSKAFDTLNFDILLYKLQYYGVTSVSFELIRSYLTNRNELSHNTNKTKQHSLQAVELSQQSQTALAAPRMSRNPQLHIQIPAPAIHTIIQTHNPHRHNTTPSSRPCSKPSTNSLLHHPHHRKHNTYTRLTLPLFHRITKTQTNPPIHSPSLHTRCPDPNTNTSHILLSPHAPHSSVTRQLC